MLRRDSQRPIEEMSEFMERRAGLRDVDGFLAVVGGSNAAHVQLLAELTDVVKVDTVCPAGGIKGGKHRLRHLPQRQQVVIDIDAYCVYQSHRRGRSPHGEGAGQNGVKEHGSVPAGDDLVCIILLAAELKLFPDVDSKTENQAFRKSKVTEAQTPATSMIFENRKSGLSICSGYIAGKVFHINDSRFSKSLPLSFNQTNTFLAVQFCE